MESGEEKTGTNQPARKLGVVKDQDTTARAVSKDVAESQIEEFRRYYRLNLQNIENRDGVEAIRTIINGLVEAVQDGFVEFGWEADQYRVIFKLRYPLANTEEFVFRDRFARAKMAMDRGKGENHRQSLFMAALCGQTDSGIFLKLRGGDGTIYEWLALLFSWA